MRRLSKRSRRRSRAKWGPGQLTRQPAVGVTRNEAQQYGHSVLPVVLVTKKLMILIRVVRDVPVVQ